VVTSFIVLVFDEDFRALPADGRRQDDAQQDDRGDQKSGADGPGDQDRRIALRDQQRPPGSASSVGKKTGNPLAEK
jgi:hypothetical protein